MKRILLSLCAGGMLAATLPAVISIAAGQSEQRLSELLRSTHVHGLAVDRSDSGRLLIATHHGLHVAEIATGTTRLVSQRPDDFMGFTAHPTDPGRLYASGHPVGGGNLGIIISYDAGASWERLSPGAGGPVDFHQMDVSKADPEVIYGVHGGLQASTDGGRSWDRIGPAPAGLIDLAASARDAAWLYAATQQGILVSRDGGASWTPAQELRRPISLVEVSASGTVYAYMVGSGLLRSDEETLDWEAVGDAFADRYLLHLAIDPGNHDRLYAVTQHGELLASGDGGESWSVLARP